MSGKSLESSRAAVANGSEREGRMRRRCRGPRRVLHGIGAGGVEIGRDKLGVGLRLGIGSDLQVHEIRDQPRFRDCIMINISLSGEHLDNSRHGWPKLRRVLSAEQTDLQELACLFGIKISVECCVYQQHQLFSLIKLPCPFKNILLFYG